MASQPQGTLAQAKAIGQPSDQGRFMRLPDVIATTGLSRSAIYRLIAAGEFPKQDPLTKRAVGWWEAEVAAWNNARRRQPG